MVYKKEYSRKVLQTKHCGGGIGDFFELKNELSRTAENGSCAVTRSFRCLSLNDISDYNSSRN
ncbi:hypothetical protein BpHYR1_026551 [Brachionus plicatilis]|uniref:Uncharacterized protein n=1 Tax=Brachionus plicatilis TaxID=10195 RepID=A0A3M7SCC6_BRAPC|nr:hypothetical protein BpHYR1_026551 [Brachionus plicatilis]